MSQPDSFVAAVAQYGAGEDKAVNLDLQAKLLAEAARQGAQLVVLPEYSNCLGRFERVVEQSEPIPGPTSERLGQLAAEHQLWIVAGICEASDRPGKAHNTLLVIAPSGGLVQTYRKIHLFDINLPGEITFEESKCIIPGDSVRVVETPWTKLGLATCYDLRFPELFRALVDEGAEVVAFPSAFSAPTGRAHWDVLVRARAIENQVYFLASNQIGQPTPRLATYGHSMIVDPWGRPVCQLATESPAILCGRVEKQRLRQVRRHLPALSHRRWPVASTPRSSMPTPS